MPDTKADPKAVSPLSSTQFEQSVQSQERRHHAPAGCSEKRLFPAGTSPDPPLFDHFLSGPPQRDMPASQDFSSIKWTSKSMTDRPQVSSYADEKTQKKTQHYLGRLLTGNAADISSAQSGLTRQSDAAALSLDNELERLIKDLENQAYKVALRLSRCTDKIQKRHLHLKLYNLEKNIRKNQGLLGKYKTKNHPAQVPKESSADPLSLAPDDTTLLAQKLQADLFVQEQPRPKDSPASSSQSQDHEQEVAFSERIYGLDHRLPAPVPAEPRRPETQESPEDEWTDIKLEDAEEPLGQEEWEDDIAPGLIPKGAAQNPYYPGKSRILWSGVPPS